MEVKWEKGKKLLLKGYFLLVQCETVEIASGYRRYKLKQRNGRRYADGI